MFEYVPKPEQYTITFNGDHIRVHTGCVTSTSGNGATQLPYKAYAADFDVPVAQGSTRFSETTYFITNCRLPNASHNGVVFDESLSVPTLRQYDIYNSSLAFGIIAALLSLLSFFFVIRFRKNRGREEGWNE